jgi:3',5'-cyclic AMP phosphodiesterase CpdA
MSGRQESGRSVSRAGRRWRIAGLVVLGVVVVAIAATFAVFPRQTISRLTHWVGPPTEVSAYEPLQPAPEWHLAVAGDVGDSGRRLDTTGATMARVDAMQPYDDLLLLGDNVYWTGDPANLPDTVFGPFGALLGRGVGLLAILGNHDVLDGHGDAQMAAMGMPGRYWSKTVDDLLLIGLDSNNLDPEQVQWLERTLAGSDATWKLVALHHPPYSAGYQGSSTEVRALLEPIFIEHGVQLVLSGHDHDYQRSTVIDGVTYIVTGGGSGTRRTGRDPFTAQSFAWLHFVDIGVYPDRMVVRAIGSDREATEVGDEVVILP